MVGTCDVCDKEGEVFVRASHYGAISYAYCKECLEKGLQPYWGMVAYISGAGKFPEDINEAYQEDVRFILKELGISEKQFSKDVEEAIEEMRESFEKYCEKEEKGN